jgi:hypothetical protein
MIHLDSRDSRRFRWTFAVVGALMLAGAAALAMRAQRLGWPSGAWKAVALPVAIGLGMIAQAVTAPRPVGPGRRKPRSSPSPDEGR